MFGNKLQRREIDLKLRFKLIKEIDSKNLNIQDFDVLPVEKQRQSLLDLLDVDIMAEIDKIIDGKIGDYVQDVEDEDK